MVHAVRLTEMLTAINIMRKEGLPNAEKYMAEAEQYYAALNAKGVNINLGN